MFDSSIRFHARAHPHAIAVSTVRRDVSYSQFDRDIDRFAAALAEAGVLRSQLAVVGVSDLYLDCVLLVALTRIGVATVTLTTSVAHHIVALAPDVLITDLDTYVQTWPVGRVLHVSTDWINQALNRPAEPWRSAPLNMDAVGRITLSSGTTGHPKTIMRSWRECDAAVGQRLAVNAGFNVTSQRPERLFNLFGLDTVLVFFLMANWVMGGALVIGGPEVFKSDEVFEKLAPTKLVASPYQLQQIMSWLPDDFLLRPELAILTGGSHLPPLLAEGLRRRITPDIWNVYASSEADAVAMGQLSQLSDDSAGWISPNADVEIVNDTDDVLPFGVVGAIRLRTPSLVKGYHDQEAVTDQHFKNGWFYPGDLGSLSADGNLRIAGRSDDLMNFGGMKILPYALETAVQGCPGVIDVAAFSAPNELGVLAPWLVIVRGIGFDQSHVAAALQPFRLPTTHLAWVDKIPRNERGKAQRDVLRTAVGKTAPVNGQ